MKKALFLLGLSLFLTTAMFAQDRKPKARVKKPTAGWRDDSLLWVKKPVDGAVTIQNPSSGNTGQTQDKLGNFEIQDVKSPRDAASGQATGRRQHKPIRRKPGN